MYLAKAEFLEITQLPGRAWGTSTICRSKGGKDLQAPTRHQLPCAPY